MSEQFFVSDTHFSHANVLKFTDNTTGKPIRPDFKDVDDMDEQLIQNWNSVVSPKDTVYHLGDVGFNAAKLHQILPRLNGRKYLALGNHDDLRWNLYKFFVKINLWYVFKKENFLASHTPTHDSNLYKVRYNIHGHNHQNPDVSPLHLNVSVERTNFTPIHIDEVVRRLHKKDTK